jgi:UDP-N-acetylglucosamine--N-acetylmuramyl-(pentapeptide) pyrophosphoryl-undecaprenol N-acetylglucosamine transferase
MPRTFVMAGGGTGGHVVPALAVARELRSRGYQALFIGVQRGMEARLVPAEGFPIEWIEIGGLNRVGLQQKIVTLADLPLSVWHAARILDRVKPPAIFSMGGFVAGPVLMAALWKRIPVVVMEPNAIPGFTHRMLAHFVARALVSFPETGEFFPKGRTELTGLPIREEFFQIPRKPVGKEITILITGGSQGSRTLNRAAEQSWTLWEKGRVRMIHQTGALMYDELAPKFKASGMNGEVSAFLSNMPAVFEEADLVVSRSGAGAVSELAAAGKPAILVPFPGASDDHQLKNAQAMENAGAAKVILDAEMTGQRLVEEVMKLARDTRQLEAMGAAAKQMAKPGAARRAADILESFLPQNQRVDRDAESRNNT